MKIYKGWLQALLSPTPRGFAARSRVLARLASLAQIGELARRLANLLRKFSIGETTGRKLDAEVVAREMRRARGADSVRLFQF